MGIVFLPAVLIAMIIGLLSNLVERFTTPVRG
jgi:Na+-transporting methylmalonyl-CoA/oxaloacetate decarboxylase gamma subunit